MPENSTRFYQNSTNRNRIVPFASALVGAGFFLLVFHGWWLDGFALGMGGMLIGQHVGFLAIRYLPMAKRSDVPFVLAAQIGIGIMVAIWLCLPESTVAVLGYIAKTFDGAALGYMVIAFARIESQIRTSKLPPRKREDPHG